MPPACGSRRAADRPARAPDRQRRDSSTTPSTKARATSAAPWPRLRPNSAPGMVGSQRAPCLPGERYGRNDRPPAPGSTPAASFMRAASSPPASRSRPASQSKGTARGEQVHLEAPAVDAGQGCDEIAVCGVGEEPVGDAQQDGAGAGHAGDVARPPDAQPEAAQHRVGGAEADRQTGGQTEQGPDLGRHVRCTVSEGSTGGRAGQGFWGGLFGGADGFHLVEQLAQKLANCSMRLSRPPATAATASAEAPASSPAAAEVAAGRAWVGRLVLLGQAPEQPVFGAEQPARASRRLRHDARQAQIHR